MDHRLWATLKTTSTILARNYESIKITFFHIVALSVNLENTCAEVPAVRLLLAVVSLTDYLS